MGSDEDLLALENERPDLLVKVGQGPVGGELEALAARGRDVVAPPPDVHLLLSPLLPRVVLVQTGELAVVTLVERLVLVDRKVGLLDALEDDVESGLGTLEVRGEGDVELVAALGELLRSLLGLFTTLLRELRILPTGEEVQLCARCMSAWSARRRRASAAHCSTRFRRGAALRVSHELAVGFPEQTYDEDQLLRSIDEPTS